MTSRTRIVLALLVAALLALAGCRSQPTPTPTPKPTPVPPTAVPMAPTTQPPGGIEVAWQHVIQPQVPVVARVNGVDITAEEYLAILRREVQLVTYRYSVDWNDPENQSLLASFQDQVLEQMIQRLLARQLAAAEGLVISDAEREAERADIQSNVMQSGAYASWESFLALIGSDPEDFDQQITDYLIFQKLIVSHGGPEAVEQVHAAHILVDNEETGKEVLDKLKAGISFADLAAQYSTDTSNKDQGGDLGWFPRGVMVSEFEEAAFALNAGETSGLVKTDFGYHIIQVMGKEIRALDPDLLEQLQQQNFNAWFDAELSKANIETLVQFQEPTR